MKKILIILFLSMIANASCIQMIEKSDIIKGKITISYCDKNQIEIKLKNRNPYLQDFSLTIPKSQFEKFDKALHKTLSWYDKAKNNNIDITKMAYNYQDKIVIFFKSENNGRIIFVTVVGANNEINGGSFSTVDKKGLISFVKKIDHILKNGEKEFKKQTELFK